MTHEPVVSVVIPTRNRARSLDRTIASILGSSPTTPFEVVVVDNASDDDTDAVIRRWADRDPRIRPVRETEIGRSPALQAGTEAATGRLLLFTDDDVLVESGWIDAYAAFFERRPEVSIAGGPITPLPEPDRRPAWYGERAARSLGMVAHDGERPLDPGEHVWGANMAVRSSIFEQIGGWRTDLGVRGAAHPTDPGQTEDVEFQYRARDRGRSVWFCPEAGIRHLVDVRPPGWLLRRAFVNGRNSRHRRPWPGMPVVSTHPPGSGAAIVIWTARTVGVVIDAMVFRLRPTRPRFDRAWLRAWTLGWAFEDAVTAGRGRQLDGAIQAATRTAVGLAARVAGRS